MGLDRMLNHNNNVSTTTNIPQYSQNQQIQFEFFSDGLSLDSDRDQNNDTFINFLRTTGSKNLSCLITNLARDKNYSCVIVVNPLLLSAIDVATELGIPCAFLWVNCALFSISYRYFMNIDSFPNFEDPNAEVQLPGLPMLEVGELPSFMLPSTPSRHRQIGYPMWLDHPLTAKLVVNKFQNGVVMSRGEHGVASVEEIDTSAREIKQRAMEVKEVAIKALEEGGSSDKSLNQFVNDMINADNSASA